MADNDNLIEAYKAYFDLWTKTRNERLDYNKYFLTLLFVDTLVAVFTAVLGATTSTAYPGLTRLLLLVMLAAAIAISLVWACKLFMLNIVEGSQQSVLKEMERRLFEGEEVDVKFCTEVFPFRKEERHAKGILWMGLFQDRQKQEERTPAYRHSSWWASYWALPCIFFVAFIILFVWLLFVNPFTIPVPSPPAPLNVTLNGTLHI